MAVAEQAQPASRAVRARARRVREEELLVWPDLVFVEFISAVLFLGLIAILSIMVDAILLDQANPAVTPNPSKAPWYFLNLQELLLHMHPALAGVIVPTVALIALGAIPYFDTSNEYQGEWLSSPRAWPNLITGAIVGAIGTTLLIFYDASFHVRIFEWIANPGENRFLPGTTEDNPAFNGWPEKLNFLKSLRSLQTEVNWPDELTQIPLGSKVLRTDLLGLPAIDLDVNFPAMIVEQIIPVTMMVGLPLLLSAVAWKLKLAQTKRDHMILQFSGFIAVYVTLTIIGTFFRGQGLELVPYTIFAEH
ncbi:MAG: hypothetical protein DWG79_00575 [Chloroflexi bacterium]|nr:hypothetical protein [Chloroflexota bacterium]MDA1146951.1 hypothetical protein [Chloroflexota bacterium]MQC82353.1 hypothetical protein [Chloroflexota bacterium]MQC83005.1 hypothetical protein [Chloroflexota bacterium]